MTTNWQWRIPFICQCFACCIVIVAVWFIPESPRWLLAQGRDEEALAFLVKYHGNGDPNARLVRLEIEEMREGIRIDGIDKRWWDCKQLSSESLNPKVVSDGSFVKPYRPSFPVHPQRPLALLPGYHDLGLWPVVW